MKKSASVIIEAAITLYNKNGLTNVTNQEIAKSAGISLSNLNYHFKNKEELVLEIFKKMLGDLDTKVYENNRRILQGDGMGLLTSYLQFQVSYKFFYLDSHNIMKAFPETKEGFLKRIYEGRKVVLNLLYYGVGKGYIKSPPTEGDTYFEELFNLLLMKNHFLHQFMAMTNDKTDFVEKGMWCSGYILKPYLTEKGIEVMGKELRYHTDK